MIHNIASMAPALVTAIQLEMLLLKCRCNDGADNILISFPVSSLGSIRTKLLGSDANRHTGIAVSALRAINRIATAPKTRFYQNAEKVIINSIPRVQQHSGRGFGLDIGAGMGCGQIQLGWLGLNTHPDSR